MPIFYPFHLQQLSKNIYECKKNLTCNGDCSSIKCVYRTVVSRSYYAAYSHAKIWAENQLKFEENFYFEKYRHEINSNIGRHETLIIFIKRKAKEESQKILANKLKTIKTLRTKADYDFDIKINENDAEFSIKAVDSILSYLN